MPTADTSGPHPSERRGSTHLGALLYGLIAAPAAWMAAQVVGFAAVQQACFPGYQPLAAPAFPGVQTVSLVALLAALAVCASGIVAALLAWRRTRGEHEGGGRSLLDVGEGRSRFMALTGVLTSSGFLIAVLFSLPAVVLVPTC